MLDGAGNMSCKVLELCLVDARLHNILHLQKEGLVGPRIC